MTRSKVKGDMKLEESTSGTSPGAGTRCSDEFEDVVAKQEQEVKEEMDEDFSQSESSLTPVTATENSFMRKQVEVHVIKRKCESVPRSRKSAQNQRKEYHRQRWAAMTPEQRKKEAERKREAYRRKKEERLRLEEEEWSRKKRERTLKRLMEQMTPEEIEKSKWRSRTEAAREKGQEALAHEEHLAIKRMQSILYQRRKEERLTPEQLEEWKRRTRESERVRSKRYQTRRKMLKPKKEKQERKKDPRTKQQKRQEMSEEAKAEERRRRRELVRNRTEEAKERERFRIYSNTLMKLAAMTDEERRALTEKNTEVARKWRESLTGEKLEKFREYNRSRARERFRNMTREEYLEHLRKARERHNQKVANGTPEERLKRLRKYQVNAAVRKLKKQLGEEGATQEEISKQVEELKKRMWEEPLPPPETISTFKPRPRRNQKYGDLDVGDATTCVPKRPTGRPPGLAGPRTQNKMGLPVKQTENVNESEAAGDKELAVNLEADTSGIPKRRRGRPPGPSRRQIRTEPDPNPPVKCPDAVSKSEAGDDNDGGGVDRFDLDSFCDSLMSFDENDSNSASMPTPTTDVQEEDEVEQVNPTPILQFDLKCPHCPFIHSERSELLHHLSSEHPTNCWKCPSCKSIMLSPAELQEHFKSEHSNATSSDITSNDHYPKPIEIQTPSALAKKGTTSVSQPTTSNSFHCIKCSDSSSSSVFESHQGLLEHMKSNHPESYWPCPNCNILRYSEKGLNTHRKLCTGSSERESRSKTGAGFPNATNISNSKPQKSGRLGKARRK